MLVNLTSKKNKVTYTDKKTNKQVTREIENYYISLNGSRPIQIKPSFNNDYGILSYICSTNIGAGD